MLEAERLVEFEASFLRPNARVRDSISACVIYLRDGWARVEGRDEEATEVEVGLAAVEAVLWKNGVLRESAGLRVE